MAFYDQINDASTFHYWVGSGKDAFGTLAKAYRAAAKRLTNSLLRRRASYEACAVVFLYRHALELSLKHAIYKAAEIARYSEMTEVEDRLHNHHDLRKLTKILEKSVTLFFPNDSFLQDLVAKLNTTTQELTEIDPTSYVFRYPIDREGHPVRETCLNLRAFSRHMDALLEDLDTLNLGLNAQSDIAQNALTAFAEAFGENEAFGETPPR